MLRFKKNLLCNRAFIHESSLHTFFYEIKGKRDMNNLLPQGFAPHIKKGCLWQPSSNFLVLLKILSKSFSFIFIQIDLPQADRFWSNLYIFI